jgi:hypothetical protein
MENIQKEFFIVPKKNNFNYGDLIVGLDELVLESSEKQTMGLPGMKNGQQWCLIL